MAGFCANPFLFCSKILAQNLGRCDSWPVDGDQMYHFEAFGSDVSSKQAGVER